jgi:hypothetical protein
MTDFLASVVVSGLLCAFIQPGRARRQAIAQFVLVTQGLSNPRRLAQAAFDTTTEEP